jgi:signal transduction histidine kinase
MENTTYIVPILSLLTTLTMGFLSYVSYRSHKDEAFMNLTEFWAALGLNVVVAAIFAEAPIQYVALTMVGWIWPLRGLRLFYQKLSGIEFNMKWAQVALGMGGFLSVALATYGQPFIIYAAPFSLALGGTGLYMTNIACKNTQNKTMIAWTFLFANTMFFTEKVLFPWWRVQTDFALYSSGVDLFLLLLMAGSCLALTFERQKKLHEQELESLVKERNQKLYGQSKYSELGMMSAGIAHEINNPLAVIQARTTQLLRMYRDPEKNKELGEGLSQILYTSERINRTIQGVREFVHQDDNASHKDIGLKDLVDDVLVFCGQRMKNHGVNLRFYGLQNHTLKGNKIQLEQVILNLINNSFDAIEFLPEKWIEMSVNKTDEKLQIFFKDSGAGIPPEVSARIMEPFFSTKDLRKGTGLGLALAKGIIEQHGGTLTYVKDASHTTFLIELPQRPEADWGINAVH